MFGMNGLRVIGQRFLVALLTVWIGLGLMSCHNLTTPQPLLGPESDQSNRLAGRLAEVAPPKAIQELRQVLESYQPQVKILSPRSDQVFENEPVTVRFQVQDLPVFQNPEWGLGPHLNVLLDDQPYQAVYDSNQTLVLSDLSPGSHTIRVFAARPWNESFKNEGAYAQTTFHILTRTSTNNPSSAQPLLTFSSPQDTYGTEPILLDFYLTNAPLHMIAQEDPDDDVPDWRIRCTINGESFVFDQWQPIYLEGFKSGMNWIQLELINEMGNLIPNTFNDTVRLIEYEPKGTDSLSKIVRGELAIADILGIVDPDYTPPQPEPEPTELEPAAESEEIAPTPGPETEPILVPESKAEEPPASPMPESGGIPVLEPEPDSEPELAEPEPEPKSGVAPESEIETAPPSDTAPAAKKSVEQTEVAPSEVTSPPANAPETEAEWQPQAAPTIEEMEGQTESPALIEAPAETGEEIEQPLETPVAEPEGESLVPDLSQPVESPLAPSDTATPAQKTTENLDNFYHRAQDFFRSGRQQIRDRFSKPDFIPADAPPKKPEALDDYEGATDLSSPAILPETEDDSPEISPNSDTQSTLEEIPPESSQPIQSSPPLSGEAMDQPTPNFTENLNVFYHRAQDFFRSGMQQTRDRFSQPNLIPSEDSSKTPEAVDSKAPIDQSSPENLENLSETWDDDAPDSLPNSDLESSATLDETAEVTP